MKLIAGCLLTDKPVKCIPCVYNFLIVILKAKVKTFRCTKYNE